MDPPSEGESSDSAAPLHRSLKRPRKLSLEPTSAYNPDRIWSLPSTPRSLEHQEFDHPLTPTESNRPNSNSDHEEEHGGDTSNQKTASGSTVPDGKLSYPIPYTNSIVPKTNLLVYPIPKTRYVAPIPPHSPRNERIARHVKHSIRLTTARKIAADSRRRNANPGRGAPRVSKRKLGLRAEDLFGDIEPSDGAEFGLKDIFPNKKQKSLESHEDDRGLAQFQTELRMRFSPIVVGPDHMQHSPVRKRKFTLADVTGTRPRLPLSPNAESHQGMFGYDCEEWMAKTGDGSSSAETLKEDGVLDESPERILESTEDREVIKDPSTNDGETTKSDADVFERERYCSSASLGSEDEIVIGESQDNHDAALQSEPESLGADESSRSRSVSDSVHDQERSSDRSSQNVDSRQGEEGNQSGSTPSAKELP